MGGTYIPMYTNLSNNVHQAKRRAGRLDPSSKAELLLQAQQKREHDAAKAQGSRGLGMVSPGGPKHMGVGQTWLR